MWRLGEAGPGDGEKIIAGSGVQLGYRIKFSCSVEAGSQWLTTVCFKMTSREDFECSWHKETVDARG